MSFAPLGENVLLRINEAPTKTNSGILLPETAKSSIVEADVVAVGKGLRNLNGDFITPEVQVGDRVALIAESGMELNVDGEKLRVAVAPDILGIISRNNG